MLTCPSCGQENPQGFRFCGACAASLEAEKPAAREERKVVTVLFADLVGFTARAERMDPEEVRSLLQPYHAHLRRELERHGGTVEKFIGDAVMAVFGAPVAHEDDPERAVRAALAIREWASEGDELEVRIAVSTGEALVSLAARPADGEGIVAGDVVNTAARLQSAAPVNGILVGETTYNATRRVIEYREHAVVEAKGKTQPIRVWEAVDAVARLGLDVRQGARAPLVGRDEELGTLVTSLNRSKREREPQLVTLVGVPGIGKSRLVYELLRQVENEPELVYWRQGRSLPYGTGMPLWALGEIVKAHAGILESDGVDVAGEKLADAVRQVIDEDENWTESHLRTLVGLGGTDEGTGGDRRSEAFAAWRRFLEAIAETGPLVLIFEDLHWAHDALLDFVEHLVEWAEGVPMLIVGTARPELLSRRPAWGGGTTNAVTLRLSALTDEDTARLVHTLLERSALPSELQSMLLERAEGNPLYAEEFVGMVVERGAKAAGGLPESVQGIIAARLDALPAEEKAVLQDAAVLGKVFWSGAVASLGDHDRAPLEQLFHELARRDFVRRERRSVVARETEYAFRHALVRDVAYTQIPRPDRIEKHRRAAAWIEELGRPDDHAEMLAHHYMAALDLARALGQEPDELAGPARRALARAADRAYALNAFDAAADYSRRALELWPTDDPERAHVLLRRGRALRWADNGGDDVLAEARDLLMAQGDPEPAVEAELVLADLGLVRDRDFDGAQARIEAAAGLLAQVGPSAAKANVFAQLARLHLIADRTAEALDVGRQALDAADAVGDVEVRAHALNTVGAARAQLGDLGGISDLEASLELARSIGSGPQILRAYNNLMVAVETMGDLQHVYELGEEAIRDAERLGGHVAATNIRANQAHALYALGRWDEGLGVVEGVLASVGNESESLVISNALPVRTRIRFARGDQAGALDDAQKTAALDAAAPPFFRVGSKAEVAWIMVQTGRREEAAAIAEDVVAFAREKEPNRAWSSWLIDLLVQFGYGDDAVAMLEASPRSWWNEGAMHLARLDYEAAAAVFAGVGNVAEEAYWRLRAGEQLVGDARHAEAAGQLERALGFYRDVGATHHIREAEALLTVSVTNRASTNR